MKPKRRNIMDEIMAEPMRLPGCPQLVVTRDFAYQWLKSMGYDPSGKGFGSLDWLVFLKAPVDEALTDIETRDTICKKLEPFYRSDED